MSAITKTYIADINIVNAIKTAFTNMTISDIKTSLISQIIASAKSRAYTAINTAMVEAYMKAVE